MKIHMKSFKEIFFYFGMIIQLFYTARIITVNSYENSNIYVVMICILFLIPIVLEASFTKNQFQILVVMLGCSILHLLVANDTNLLRISLMLIAAKSIDVVRMKRFLSISYVIVFLTVILLSIYAGFNTVYQEKIWRVKDGFTIRYNLGFDGPIRMMFVWVCVMTSILIFQNKKNLKRDIVFMIISLYLFSISDSYTGLFGSLIALGMPYILDIFRNKSGYKIYGYAVKGSLLFVLMLTFVSGLIDISATKLGVFLNGRTGALYRLISGGIYPSLFGGDIPAGVKGLDNSYFYCFYLLGIIPMILFLAGIWRLGNIIARNKDLYGCSSAITFIALAYVGQVIEYPYLNYLLFIMMGYWNEMMVLKTVKKKDEADKVSVHTKDPKMKRVKMIANF